MSTDPTALRFVSTCRICVAENVDPATVTYHDDATGSTYYAHMETNHGMIPPPPGPTS
jgi:hypothetical protein